MPEDSTNNGQPEQATNNNAEQHFCDTQQDNKCKLTLYNVHPRMPSQTQDER